MRADFAMLELFDLQSTSDQQDFRLYPAIAAGAPVQMLPEQAGNWAYPQAWMSDEEIAFTMVTGLSGRLYLSGFLDRMAPAQLELVQGGHRALQGDPGRHRSGRAKLASGPARLVRRLLRTHAGRARGAASCTCGTAAARTPSCRSVWARASVLSTWSRAIPAVSGRGG